VSEWNDALTAAQKELPFVADQLEALKRRPPACLHPELTFESGDYYVLDHACGAKWARTNPNHSESGTDATGQQVGGDPASANDREASGLSGNKRIAVEIDPDRMAGVKLLPPDCLHLELAFDSGDYLVLCHACSGRWVQCNPAWPEYGRDAAGKDIGCSPTTANHGAGAGLSGHRRVEPK
jgi:hypothetical protein